MSNRFEDCTNDVIGILNDVKEEYFPELRSAKIHCIFDLKKRKKNGNVVIAQIRKTNDLLRNLSSYIVEDGFDYILSIDKIAWDNVEREDRIRIIRHELRHCYVDFDSTTSPYKLVPHNFEDFHEEIALNIDDPNWSSRVANLTEDIYEQIREQE